MAKKNLKEVKANVMDLLNEIIILTKGLDEPQYAENYNYQLEAVTSSKYKELKEELADSEETDAEELLDVEGEKLKKPNDDEVYLYLVGEYAKRVVDGDAESASYN